PDAIDDAEHHHEVVGRDAQRITRPEHPVEVFLDPPGVDVVGDLDLLRVPVDEVAQHLGADGKLDLRVVVVRGEEIRLHGVLVVRMSVLGVEESRLKIEPVVEFDQAVDLPPRTAAALGEDLAQLFLDGGPPPFGIVVPTDDANRIAPMDKMGERVKDRWMTFGGAPQLPDALRLRRSEAQGPFLTGDFEGYRLLRHQRDGNEVDDVAVQNQMPRLGALAVRRMVQKERGQRSVRWTRSVKLVAGAKIAAEVEVGDGQQVVRPLR